MSTDADSPIADALRLEGQNGDATYVLPYTESLARQSALQGLAKQVEPTPDPAGAREDGEEGRGGIVRRANEFRSRLGPVALESLGLHGMELAKAISRRADELYRNQFPYFEERFVSKCEACGAEFDQETDLCEDCGAPTREPSQQQRTRAEEFFEDVNKEGQSLRELYEFLETDGGRLGVWLHVVKKEYELEDIITGEVSEDVQELVRGDPKRIKPVVDENGRIGGHWWACPLHRDPKEFDLREGPGRCHHCAAQLREVFFAEVENIGDDKPVKVYFEEEVITHAPFIQLLAGLDGLSPIDNLWLKQAILEWMDLYAAGFYDQENTNRYPGRLVVVHTNNPDDFESALDEAQDEAEEDPYTDGFIYAPKGPDGETAEAQVIDLMNNELLGQSDSLKQDYKSDIRSVYGLVDAQDSELSDAGGLNNEGLQLEVNDRDKASHHQDLREGPLKKLMDVLGFDDWFIKFVPPELPEEEPSTLETVQAAATAKQNGIDYRIEDGRVELLDTDGPADVDDAPDDGDPDDDTPTEVQPPDVDIEMQGDPMANGHQLDPATGEGVCESTGETIEAETMGDLTEDCPHCGEPLSVFGGDTNQQAAEPLDGALRTLEELQKELCWPDPFEDGELTQQAREPFFADNEDMPQFVRRLIEQALNAGSVYLGEYDAPNVTGKAVKNFFREKLDQPQGWSVESLGRDFADRFNLEFEEAVSALRTQLTSVLNESREQGYRQQGNLDERRFKWLGPIDDQKTDASWEIIRKTNPDFGGTPRPLDELKEIVHEARDRHWEDFDGGEWADGYNDRDTFVEVFT